MKYLITLIPISLLWFGCGFRIQDGVYTPAFLRNDNAVAIRFALEDAFEKASPDEETLTVAFQPKPAEPYWVLFLPNRDLSKQDFLDAGVPAPITEDIFKEMDYFSAMRGWVILYPMDGRLSFQGHPTRQENIVCLSKGGEAFKLVLDNKSKKILNIE